MSQNNIENVKSQMRRGVLEYCILSILDKSDAYASELIGKLKEARIIVVEGTLYPLLTRQKTKGCLPTDGKNPLRALRANTIP